MAVHEYSARDCQHLAENGASPRAEHLNAMIIRWHVNGGCTVFDSVDDAMGHPSAELRPPVRPAKVGDYDIFAPAKHMEIHL